MAEIIKIDEKTYRIEDGGVRIFLLMGNVKALLVDTGMNLPNAKEIAESLTDLPVELINTHADRDHISGNAAFDTFRMHPREVANYIAAGGEMKPIYHVRGGDVLDLGGRELKIFDLPGHTPGSIAILDVASRVLYGGDSIQDGNIFMFGRYRNLEEYIDSMEKLWENRDQFDVVYPAHSTPCVSKDIIPSLIEGARKVLAGEVPCTKVDMHGNEVGRYDIGCAAFLYVPKPKRN